mgnify:CR=1 FL=1
MIYDELIEELALTLLTKARYEGCISVIDGFSQCEEDKTRIEYPVDAVMRIMPVGSEIWPEECEPLLKKIGAETIGDVADIPENLDQYHHKNYAVLQLSEQQQIRKFKCR